MQTVKFIGRTHDACFAYGLSPAGRHTAKHLVVVIPLSTIPPQRFGRRTTALSRADRGLQTPSAVLERAFHLVEIEVADVGDLLYLPALDEPTGDFVHAHPGEAEEFLDEVDGALAGDMAGSKPRRGGPPSSPQEAGQLPFYPPRDITDLRLTEWFAPKNSGEERVERLGVLPPRPVGEREVQARGPGAMRGKERLDRRQELLARRRLAENRGDLAFRRHRDRGYEPTASGQIGEAIEPRDDLRRLVRHARVQILWSEIRALSRSPEHHGGSKAVHHHRSEIAHETDAREPAGLVHRRAHQVDDS